MNYIVQCSENNSNLTGGKGSGQISIVDATNDFFFKFTPLFIQEKLHSRIVVCIDSTTLRNISEETILVINFIKNLFCVIAEDSNLPQLHIVIISKK